jgi:DNA-binding response OmpR family regulator
MKKVLIIEDDEKVARALHLRIKNAGYEISMACDALGGVMTAARVKPDAVLLDIFIPAGNGFSVAQRIQAIIPGRTPIIFITASRKPDLFDRAIKLGASGFVEKPYDPAKLLELLHNVLEKTPYGQNIHAVLRQ